LIIAVKEEGTVCNHLGLGWQLGGALDEVRPRVALSLRESLNNAPRKEVDGAGFITGVSREERRDKMRKKGIEA
jgi:hypothetical protein